MNYSEMKLRARAQLKTRYWYVFLMTLIVGIISGASIPMIVGLLLMGPLTVGLSYALIDVVENPNGSDNYEFLFEGFKQSFVTSFLAILLIRVFTFLWSLLFIIPGIIKAFSYSMTAYIIAEDPTIDPMAAIAKSQEMMRGHKFELFMLHLSFIGWYLLGILTFGLALFFVIPYVETTVANFYVELRGKKVIKAEYIEQEMNA
ncbi:MAG: DUF975 family protein [Acholeplasmataceae bacterium]|nr:DUF975 family protein [Acholeplasmataceae bacterium]